MWYEKGGGESGVNAICKLCLLISKNPEVIIVRGFLNSAAVV